MSNDTLAERIKEQLPEIASEEAILAECVNLCKNYNVSAEDFRFKIEALKFGQTGVTHLTLDTLATLKTILQRERAAQSASRAQPRSSLAINFNFNRRNAPPRPAATAPHVKPEPTDGGLQLKPGPSTVVLRGPSSSEEARKKRAYRYMHEKLSARGNALDERIDEFAERIREHYDIADISDPSGSTSEEVTVVGRIVQDDDAAEDSSKLVEGGIALESSRNLGQGSRIPLRFNSDLRIRGGVQGGGSSIFFPGAIAALRGKNGGGGYFQVSEVLTLPPLLPTPDAKTEGDSAFSVVIASGPFTSDQDLNFQVFNKFMAKLPAHKPAVIILMGPFLDALHPSIKAGDIDIPPQKLFRVRFLKPLKECLKAVPGSIALIIPSVRDIISDHAVFPQCELPATYADDPESPIHLLPNPATFTLNGITFGATSADVLFHLKKGEFGKRGQEVEPTPVMPDDVVNDPMTNLCRHLLQQRSFYPVFPVPLDVANEVILDVSHWDGLRMGVDDHDQGAPESAPDVLILPSRFKQFSKTVYGTMALNPSFVYKGSYIVLDVAARGLEAESTRTRLSARIEKIEG
ncbi:DNA polymerase alpha/epsilon subunit B-domain-containing protein [Roridomyces roridus]|uniref:DNA polymerase alpha subunit B n=1 Tax=Roridomyces roridus TaxID=1738132 RepID=A0AAD7CDF4_9AGAR|nr:DNA polymerase alpha/epsilon subunit B-domain-containing protein [Roridomyces roridus]